MNNITFMKPVVLISSLSDMENDQREQAVRFLTGTDVLTVEESGTKIVPYQKVKNNQICFYGSEAVCVYRQMLGLPDVGIRNIKVNKILRSINCYECMSDILFFLRRVDTWADRFMRLSAANAPLIILINEYRVLRERVEYLQDNNWCDNPILDSYDIKDDDGSVEHHDDVRKSLVNIGYDLLTSEQED